MDKTNLTVSSVPCLLDADLSQLPREDIQSGIGYGDDLKFQQVVEVNPLHWAPQVQRGFYYSGLDVHYLHADSAIVIIPRQTVSTTIPLPVAPLEGEPVSVVTYFREADGRIRAGYRWEHKIRFTGNLVQEGEQSYEQIDLDQDGQVVNYNLAYADQSRTEFVLRRYHDCITQQLLPTNLGEGGVGAVSITLDPPAIPDLPLHFTNELLFQKRVTTNPMQPGEWHLSSDGNTLTVYLNATPVDPGRITYYHHYPAELLFARSYTLQHGQLTNPQSLKTTEILGTADGSARPCFFCRYFPIINLASVYVFIEENGVVSSWTAVADLSSYGPTDQVCAVDLDLGLVRFGDGVHGKIPAAGSRIGIVYTSVPMIRYECRSDKEYTGKEVNLHPLLTPIHQGFLYLGHQVDILRSLTLSCDKPELSPGVYGPLYCGNDYVTLTCTATNPKGEPVADLQVEFVVGAYGHFSQLPPGINLHQSTMADGRARAVFHPPGNIINIAEVVELYDQEENFLNPYQSITNTNDALTVSSDDLGSTDYYNEALTFLLLDDDPLLPYSPYRRRGGGMVLLYHLDESTNSFTPTRPLPVAGNDYLQYPHSLPTPTELPSLRKFVIALPKIVTIYCRAYDPLSGREIRSNPITILIKAPAFQVGPYTVKRIHEQTAGSAVGAATYLAINQQGELNTFFGVGIQNVAAGIYPVPGVKNQISEYHGSTPIGELLDATILVTHDEREIILYHTDWTDYIFPSYSPFESIYLKNGYTAVSQSVMGDGRTLYSFAISCDCTAIIPSGQLYGKIYAHTGTFGVDGKPTGNPLVTCTNYQIGAGGAKFTLSEPFVLQNNTPYCFVVEHNEGNNSSYYYVKASTTDKTPGNMAYYYYGNWTAVNKDIDLIINPSDELIFVDVMTTMRRIDVASRSIVYERRYLNPTPNCTVLPDNTNCFTCSPLYYYQCGDIDEQGYIYAASCEGWGPLVKIRKSDFAIVDIGEYQSLFGWQTEQIRVSRNPNYPYLYSWYDTGFVLSDAVYLHHRDTLENPFDQETTESKYPEGWEGVLQYTPYGFVWLGPYSFSSQQPSSQICWAGAIDNRDGGLWMLWVIKWNSTTTNMAMTKYLPDGTMLGPWDVTEVMIDAIKYSLMFDPASNQLITYNYNNEGNGRFCFLNASTMTLNGFSPVIQGAPYYQNIACHQRGVVNGKLMSISAYDHNIEDWVYKLTIVDVNTRQIIKTADISNYITKSWEYDSRNWDVILYDGVYIDSKKSAFILLRQNFIDMQEVVGFF